ncbi:katanin, putative [Trypanosoma equiperdum]|uniref:Katanin, putative n=2 Tax=Trypanozoon TaxID=39700 RepID=Q38E06_TRYB2|nr:katanin, putative [Trypanosoma brucei brucei TREU927]EAN76964.1 katanin, putative [Trypanosoma brucei brucei TREU927]SCU64853.1 katanin, putative [Trypanosoma equiperdum]
MPVIDSMTLQLPCQVYHSRFSPDSANRLVGLGCRDGGVHVYPFEDYSRTVLLSAGCSPSTSIAFDPQQRRLVGGTDEGSLHLWDMTTEGVVRTFGDGHKSTVTGVDFHPHTDVIATCSRDSVLRVWDTRKKSCVRSHMEAKAPLCATEFSPSGRWCVSGCADGVVRLYDLQSGKEMHEFRAHSGPVTSICFHPKRYYLAVGSSDGSVSFWELEGFTKIFQSKCLDTPVDAVYLSGKRMLVAASHILRVYDFDMMSDSFAPIIESQWNIIGDLNYSSNTDEALFVEFSGQTAVMGRVPLADGGLTIPPIEKTVKSQQRDPPSFNRGEENAKMSVPVLRAAHQRLHRSPSQVAAASHTGESGELQMDDLLTSSVTTVSVLRQRLTHLRVLRALWVQDNQQALVYLKELYTTNSDYGVTADFLGAMQHLRMKERITLSNLSDLLDVVMYALAGERENQLLAALKVLKSMSSKFRPKLDEARRQAPSFRNGEKNSTSLTMEQYYELSAKFDAVASVVQKLGKRKGPVGEEVREVLNEIPLSS